MGEEGEQQTPEGLTLKYIPSPEMVSGVVQHNVTHDSPCLPDVTESLALLV